ncbi:hypothetical protein PPSIR1_17460 [Plesiocystis pacifica SIR-1]|uniref:Uncharacterized protein n=1 Tax=Plesiocystis pacifica SIR-1 TaxID=391625 RepID=A6GA57_9BACT|nr:hypothetical protein [Plesiocystis pacifica]EDM77270.1 hypothetical protein PPSIR1_17460 [Plesiocystis pacifica SIR-1]
MQQPEAPSTAKGVPVVLSYSSLLVGLSRLIPVPFLDDIVEGQVRRQMVAAILHRHGRTTKTGEFGPLYSDGGGCLGLLWSILTFPIKLLLVPLKKLLKTVFFFLAIRDMALRMGHALMLGRCLDRQLGKGELGDALSKKERTREVQAIRAAFEESYKGSDLGVLRHALSQSLRGAKSLAAVGTAAVRSVVRRDNAVEEGASALPEKQQGAVSEGQAQVQAALEDEKVQGFLEDFDRRFDAALAAARS